MEGVTYYAANGTMNRELGRESRYGKIMVLTTKFLKFTYGNLRHV